MPWFFTSAGCKYLENMLLDNLPEILLHGSNQFVFILRDIKHNIKHKLNILWELYHPLWEPIQWKLRTNLFQFSFRFRKFILNKFFFLSPLNEFLESSTVNRKKSSVSFIWKHLRLLNSRRYEEYGILIPFFVLGYSVLQYLKVTSLTFLNLKVDFAIFQGKCSGGFRRLSANIRSTTKFAENINDQHDICFLVTNVQLFISVAVDFPAVFAL
jgi:hypothetical protein